jgi:hypothetical protein
MVSFASQKPAKWAGFAVSYTGAFDTVTALLSRKKTSEAGLK